MWKEMALGRMWKELQEVVKCMNDILASASLMPVFLWGNEKVEKEEESWNIKLRYFLFFFKLLGCLLTIASVYKTDVFFIKVKKKNHFFL